MQKGFFSKKETDSTLFVKGKFRSCASCGLSSTEQDVSVWGQGKKHILLIIDYPLSKTYIPWKGQSGDILRQILDTVGIDLYEDCYTIYSVQCPPKKHLEITTTHVTICRNKVWKKIIELQPKLIILFGYNPLFSVVGHRWSGDLSSINKWRGFILPDQDLKCWVTVTYEVSWIKEDPIKRNIFASDIQQAISYLNKPWQRDIESKIEFIEDLRDIRLDSNLVAFDYETTGIKPHAEGHRIICCSIADSPDHVYSFMIPQTRKGREPLIDILSNKNIDKMAHNMKFEHTWTLIRLKTEVQGWWWDSMIAAHILDNREGITGLKFQTFINFGVADYSSEISRYLKSVDGTSNGLNRVMELAESFGGREQLLEYCAMDSIYQYRLATKQMELMGYDDLPF